MHINPEWYFILSDIQLNMGFFFVKMNHFPVFAAPVGLGGTTHIDGFQDIGLALGVVTVQNIGSGIKFHM